MGTMCTYPNDLTFDYGDFKMIKNEILEICLHDKFKYKTLSEKFIICRNYIPGPVFNDFCDIMNISHHIRDKFEKEIIETDKKQEVLK